MTGRARFSTAARANRIFVAGYFTFLRAEHSLFKAGFRRVLRSAASGRVAAAAGALQTLQATDLQTKKVKEVRNIQLE